MPDQPAAGAAMTGGFVRAGAPLSTALLGAVAFRVFKFWLPALSAVGSAAALGGLRRRLRAIASARAADNGLG